MSFTLLCHRVYPESFKCYLTSSSLRSETDLHVILDRETIYQQPLRICDFLRVIILIDAYRRVFQFEMNNNE